MQINVLAVLLFLLLCFCLRSIQHDSTINSQRIIYSIRCCKSHAHPSLLLLFNFRLPLLLSLLSLLCSVPLDNKSKDGLLNLLLPIPFLRWFERANAWHTNSKQCRMENACTLPLIISIMNELNSSNDYYTKKRSAPIDTAVVNWFV